MADKVIRALVWDENPPHVPKELYPNSINGAVADGLNELGKGSIQAVPVHLDLADQGLPQAELEKADVLLWWGHIRHHEVDDATVARVVERVHKHGLGFVALHSAHYSKAFKSVLGATGHLKGGWREDNQPEEITVCAPRHPIAEGVSNFVLPEEEMYGAPFDTPAPACLVFQSYFPAGGEYFPCGATWTVGDGIDPKFESGPGQGVGQGEGVGRVFYFRPGHEAHKTYFDANVKRIIYNAVRWCAKLT